MSNIRYYQWKSHTEWYEQCTRGVIMTRTGMSSCRLIVAAVLIFTTSLVLGQDLDGDAIPDSIENQAWYLAAGGSPEVQDVWVECDWMPGTVGNRAQLRNRVEKVFRQAPVEGGIELHLQMDSTVPFEAQWGDVATFPGFLELWNRATLAKLTSFDGRPFAPANVATMKPFMHYCVFVNAIDDAGVSGFSMNSMSPDVGIPGDLFVVSVGQYKGSVSNLTRRRLEVGTFLHELGHNLGLTHGGANPRRHATHKPNYLSVMNYHHQFGFFRLTQGNTVRRFNYWDFSRAGSDNRVDERALKEMEGILMAPEAALADTPAMQRLLGIHFCPDGGLKAFHWNSVVDYDCDSTISSGPLRLDANLDGKIQNLGKATIDWDRMRFNGVAGAGGLPQGSGVYAPVEELDRELIFWMLEQERRLKLDREIFPR